MSQLKSVLAVAAVIVGLTIVSAEAEAKSRQGSSSSERDRAQSRDPSGTFRGYPDWARSALSPRGNGGGGR
jgi:hypothetical protein